MKAFGPNMVRCRGKKESAVPALPDGSTLSERLFKEAGDSDFEHLVFEVLGDRYAPLGLAVHALRILFW